jgi:hypothetical protein
MAMNHISSLKLSDACMTPLTDLLIAQRPYTGQSNFGSIPTRIGKVSAKGYPKHV